MGCAGQEFLDSSGTVSAAAASSTSFLVKHLKCRKGYLVCLDSANIKDLLKLETGNKEDGEGEGEGERTSFGLHLLWRSETKTHAHKRDYSEACGGLFVCK